MPVPPAIFLVVANEATNGGVVGADDLARCGTAGNAAGIQPHQASRRAVYAALRHGSRVGRLDSPTVVADQAANCRRVAC
ncbi:hypothetical protein G6F65_023287 [Rhizopus arrhizus]|nr:hypothetical protein G6F65_023287 [Rhizopus arrhizus]